MRLSDAGLLGSTLKEACSHAYLSDDNVTPTGSGKMMGCFLGGGFLAMGIGDAYLAERREKGHFHLWPNESKVVMAKLPWLTEDHVDRICELYKAQPGDDERCADYVRTIEPAEDEAPVQPEPEPEHHIHEWEGEGGAVPRGTTGN